jgi:glutamyl-tRNA reductase
MNSLFELALIGVSIRSAGLKKLEKAVNSLPQNSVIKICESVGKEFGASILSTCNRHEIYFLAEGEAFERVKNTLKQILLNSNISNDSIMELQGKHAIEHLLEVASGLDSVIIGEPEILDQIRNTKIFGFGKAKHFMKLIFDDVYKEGLEIRKDLNIKGLSWGEFILQLFFKYDIKYDKNILIVGYGSVGKNIAEILYKNGYPNIFIVNRTPEKVPKIFKSVYKLDDLNELLKYADVIITATNSSNYILDIKNLEFIPKDKEILIIDISLPRNVNPSIIEKYNNIYLLTIEEFDSFNHIDKSIISKAKEMCIIKSENIYRKIRRLEESEIFIKEIREWAEKVRSEEMQKAFKLMNGDFEHDKKVIEKLSEKIVTRLLHNLTMKTREFAIKEDWEYYRNFIKEVLGL